MNVCLLKKKIELFSKRKNLIHIGIVIPDFKRFELIQYVHTYIEKYLNRFIIDFSFRIQKEKSLAPCNMKPSLSSAKKIFLSPRFIFLPS